MQDECAEERPAVDYSLLDHVAAGLSDFWSILTGKNIGFVVVE